MTTRTAGNYFDEVRAKINRKTLRRGQVEAFEALANNHGGAGKTAFAATTALAFTRRRVLTQRYAANIASTKSPVTFVEFVEITQQPKDQP